MTAILGSFDTVTTLVGSAFDLMTSNPLLCVFFAVGLIGTGLTVFRKLKRTAR